MSLISLILMISVLGLIVWALTTYIPMAPGFKQAIYVVSVVVLLLYLLSAFGILGGAHDIRIGR